MPPVYGSSGERVVTTVVAWTGAEPVVAGDPVPTVGVGLGAAVGPSPRPLMLPDGARITGRSPSVPPPITPGPWSPEKTQSGRPLNAVCGGPFTPSTSEKSLEVTRGEGPITGDAWNGRKPSVRTEALALSGA